VPGLREGESIQTALRRLIGAEEGLFVVELDKKLESLLEAIAKCDEKTRVQLGTGKPSPAERDRILHRIARDDHDPAGRQRILDEMKSAGEVVRVLEELARARVQPPA
jgi:hypothetical protein